MHFYELTWSGVLGACHGLDVPLVFGNLTSGLPATLIDDLAAAEAVSAQMRAAWIAFATNGDPGWPTFDSGLVQIFDTDPVVAPYPEVESRKIWQDHTSRRCRSERRDRVDRRARAAARVGHAVPWSVSAAVLRPSDGASAGTAVRSIPRVSGKASTATKLITATAIIASASRTGSPPPRATSATAMTGAGPESTAPVISRLSAKPLNR